MNKLILFLMACAFTTSGIEACVTYSPSTGTYTIDHSGCVDHGQNRNHKPQKQKQNKQKTPKKK